MYSIGKCSNPICHLTPRQAELVRLMLDNPGATNQALSGRLGVSERTVKRHLSEIYHAFGVQSRGECLTVLLQPAYREFRQPPPGV
jgi:two-component system, NarL family, nitrate/nitrite response regulator NarL